MTDVLSFPFHEKKLLKKLLLKKKTQYYIRRYNSKALIE